MTATDVLDTLHVPLQSGSEGVPRGLARRLRQSPLLLAGLVIVGVIVLLAVFAPLLTSFDPSQPTGSPSLAEPSGRHWLGTDDSGRDIFAQLIYGARASLIVAAAAGSLAMLGAIVIGVLPVLVGGAVDWVSNRFVIFLLAVPGIPLLVLIGSLAGNNRAAIILVIAYAGVAPNARTLRSQTLSLRERGFIAASRGFGGGPLYVMRRHLLPGLGPLILVGFVNWAGLAIGLEAGLAFIGLGDPSAISWGLMLSRSLAQRSIYFSDMWTWWVLPPGLAISLTVVGFTFVGVALEPSFNPRWLRSA